jgi:small subunit ribosomal protein S1
LVSKAFFVHGYRRGLALTSIDSGNPANPTDPIEGSAENQPTDTSSSPSDASDEANGENSRRRLLIGSQRDPAAYRARANRDWKPIEESAGPKKENKPKAEPQERKEKKVFVAKEPKASEKSEPIAESKLAALASQPIVASATPQESQPAAVPVRKAAPSVAERATIPSLRAKDHDLEDELERMMSGASMADLMGDGKSDEPGFEPDSVQKGRVVAVRRNDIFVEFPGREQGILSASLFDVAPTPGTELQVSIQRLNPEDGLYELSLPNRTVQVDDWSDLVEGALIEVRVTGHNTGGLECEVNHIRGFIPVSQIALYRVEDLAPFVDQKLACVITESNPDRRNLVLSRRAVLEREKERAKSQMLASLEPGQTFDGVVRKLMDFGAFVELGNGVDGLIHISQLTWGRVKHPSDVLKEGQAVKVRIQKVDPETGKISLAYRDLMQSPWESATHKYSPQTVVRGTVMKLMDFGAFVELEPGVEGLVHVSEMAHKRIWRPSDVVKEGDQVDVTVLSIDPDSQRISLSMKACSTPPEPVKKEGEEDEAASPMPTKKKSNKPTGPLKGGLGKQTGERFGLKW